MSVTKAVAVNTAVQLVGKVVTTTLSLVVIAALTRYLGVRAFGEYTTVFAYVAFLGVLADFGFFWILVREIAQLDDQVRYDATVSTVLTLRVFLGIGVFVLGALVATVIPQYSAEVRLGIAIIALSWLATALNSTFVAVFQNKLRMDLAVLTDVVGRAVTLGLVLWLIAADRSLPTIFGAYVVGNGVNFSLSYWFGRRFVTIRPRFDLVEWRRIFLEAYPMGLVLILHVIYFRTNSVMLSLMQGPIQVGIFGAPFKIFEVLLTLPIMFLGNVFPMLTRLLVERSVKVPFVIQRSFDALLTIALPLTVGGIMLAEPIIRVIAGEEFVQAATVAPVFGWPATAVTVLQILMLTVGIAFVSNLFNYLLIARGDQRRLVLPYLVFGVTNVALNALFIPLWSYVGAAVATLITELLVVGYLGWLAIQSTRIQLSLTIAGRIILSTTLMGLFILWWPGQLWGTLIGAMFVYAGAASLTGVVTPAFVREIVFGGKE
jgi:O-antigen/teichoic acid export membrane protein